LLVESVTSNSNVFKEFSKDWLFNEVVTDGNHVKTVQCLRSRQQKIQDIVQARKEGVAEFLLKFMMVDDLTVSVNILETLF
jgi:hypothetical protein